jgi:hypothetical protein
MEILPILVYKDYLTAKGVKLYHYPPCWCPAFGEACQVGNLKNMEKNQSFFTGQSNTG